MTVTDILQNLQVLCTQFVSYDDNWVHLKNQHEFVYGVKHNSPIREMLAEGRSCTYYLKGSLDTRYVNKSMLVDEYVYAIKMAIPKRQNYEEIGRLAQQDFEANYPSNYTVKYMLDQYWVQLETVKRVEQFLGALATTTSYQPLLKSSPIQVIRQYAKEWEQNAQLHLGQGENSLRAQLVLALKNAGFLASAETHAYQGHADIVVFRPLNCGIADNSFEFVAECKIWKGSAAFSAALSQLCRYVTPNNSHAALIVFVNEGSFSEICNKAAQSLAKHPSCGVSSVEGDYSYIVFSLKPAQNPLIEIQATLLLCNLTTPRY
ncbi:hypothetical protein AAH211_18945 [Serratia fonticola]|uniref:hypothetical protein n=1 Tax=Serratia fonticola TaxID=47917 RepID=UPI003986C44D